MFSFSDLQSPGYNRVINENKGLRINESIGFRCALDKHSVDSKLHRSLKSPIEFIENRLSNIVIKSIPNIERAVPSASSLGSFLMKNETKYIGVIKQISNNEEFNNIITTYDPHMTVILTWKAIVSDNNSTQRATYGQNFVQLRNLYET